MHYSPCSKNTAKPPNHFTSSHFWKKKGNYCFYYNKKFAPYQYPTPIGGLTEQKK